MPAYTSPSTAYARARRRHELVVVCAGQEPRRDLVPALAALGIDATLIGGADVALEPGCREARGRPGYARRTDAMKTKRVSIPHKWRRYGRGRAEQGRHASSAGSRRKLHRRPEQASRRKLIGAGASLALGGFLPAGLAGAAAAPAGAPKANAIAPADVLKRLQDEESALCREPASGLRRTSAPNVPHARPRNIRWPPSTNCADSRVVPDLVFDQEPGDLFVCRVAGNIVNTDLLASIEYGVEFLGAVLIFVMGHSSCGAVDAAIKVVKDDAKLPGHLPDLMRAIKPAMLIAQKKNVRDAARQRDRRARAAPGRRAEALAAPIIARDYASKKIDIVGGVYDIATGKVTMI